MLAQEQEVLAQVVLGERGRIALEMLGQFADMPDVLFLGRLPVIFKLDELLELSDRRIRSVFHRPGRVPLSEDNCLAKLN